jgi:hypothetical protein
MSVETDDSETLYSIGYGTVWVGDKPFPGPWASLVIHGDHPGAEVRLEFATDHITRDNLAYFFRTKEEAANDRPNVMYMPDNPVGLNVAIRLAGARLLGKAFNVKGMLSGRSTPDEKAWETLVFSARTTRANLDWRAAPQKGKDATESRP